MRVAAVLARTDSTSGRIALRDVIALDSDRYEVTLISGGGHQANGVLYDADAVEDLPDEDPLACAHAAGIRVARIPSLRAQFSPRRDVAAQRVMSRWFASNGFTTVHTYGARAGLVGRLAAVRCGVPSIVHTVTGFPQKRDWTGQLSSAVERRLARRTNTVIAIGSVVAREALHRGVATPEQIRTVLPVGSSTVPPHGAGARGRARGRLGLPAGVRLMGTAGRIDGKRAPDDWVAAFAAATRAPGGDDVWGVWLGDGPLREQLLGRARRLGVASRLRVLTHDADVGALLPALDVFAYASRWLALPPRLIDAVAAGVPVVSTTGAAVPELLMPGEATLLVPPAQPELLGRAVRYLLDDPGEAQRLVANAHDAWAHRFQRSAPVAQLTRTNHNG